jgi:7-cyano-7-deazaguanine synthase
MPPAVVLFSGGLDSSTCLALAREDGFSPHALCIEYGQRHAFEVTAAQRVAHALAVPLKLVRIDLRSIGGSALTADVALGYAETIDAQDIYLGVNAVDYSGYPDCRPAFVEAFERLANVATAAAVEGRARYRVRAPLLQLSKKQIIEAGVRLAIPYGLTHSCYDPGPDGAACGRCDSCRLRAAGFRDAGVPDPTVYLPRSTT